MKRIKKILLNPWTIGIFSPIIATSITAKVKQIKFFEALKLLLSWLIKIITFRVPLYLIVLGILFFIVIINISVKIEERKEENRPKWLNYTTDSYKDWIFKWQYNINYYNQCKIENLRPVCQCGCELSMKDDYKNRYYGRGILLCPNCENTYPTMDIDTLDDFEKILIHKINTGNYPTDIEPEVSKNV